jgi:hypothetical protein
LHHGMHTIDSTLESRGVPVTGSPTTT